MQVYYVEYPGASGERVNWWHVSKTVPRGRIDKRWTYAYQSDVVVTQELHAEATDEHMPRGLRDPACTMEFFEEDDMVEPNEDINEDEELFLSSTSTDDDEEYISESSKDEENIDDESE